MVLDQAANFVRGDVDASIGAGDTTISVTDASEFPDPSITDYNLVLWNAGTFDNPYEDSDVEIVRVTGRDTTNDNLTVSRGQESTSDVAHATTSSLQNSWTAKMRDDIEDNAAFEGEDFDGQGTSDFSNLNSVGASAVSADGMTFIQASLQSNVTGNTAGAWVTIADNEIEDNLNEQDASFNINPNESGWYEVEALARIAGSDQDRTRIAIRDVDAGSFVPAGGDFGPSISGENTGVGLSCTVHLSAGTNYQVQVTDPDSQFDVDASGDERTWYTVKRCVVEPQ